MPKTIALAHYNQKLANELTHQGFLVVDGTYSSRPGQTADAYLYTSYRPDTDDGCLCRHEPADICLGNYHYTIIDHPATIYLNITGLTTDQIADRLHRELARSARP
ncbi:hypothetical protein [Sporomusa acidovorans]|uniref:Uncharacterized protein n=1 Tax=Sporomusa acidovorans (strain ATCC 49682 / DSM 3132 / Mol) TaxID=1123286 RepID=A0ABZ3JAA1_SPOA4|nr:hypothetical protein [Sporomusa acidovorans]OZC13306.1 hypothetical protein SPACI_58010 [Sporomusa acidovorans DSM 3132]SDD97347.1 hypothetical protein SAMN04488499_100648 [Sporomusa acidovorans]